MICFTRVPHILQIIPVAVRTSDVAVFEAIYAGHQLMSDAESNFGGGLEESRVSMTIIMAFIRIETFTVGEMQTLKIYWHAFIFR